MQIRIIIVGDDSKTHPYEFSTYIEAINFLNTKVSSTSDSVEVIPEEKMEQEEINSIDDNDSNETNGVKKNNKDLLED